MSGNGRGNMRPAGRSPPFLLIGLLVALCILAFNYWNLSGKNGTLSRQLESVQVDFRSMSDKHLVVEKRAADLSSQLSEATAKVLELQKSSSDKDAKIQELTNQLEEQKRDQEASAAHLKECQGQTKQLNQEKQQANNELQQARSQLAAQSEKQKIPPTCDKNACKDPIREVISAVIKGVGLSPVVDALKQGNVDLAQLAGDLLQVPAGEQPSAGGQHRQQQQQPDQPAVAVGDQQQQQQVVGQDPNVVQMQQLDGAGVFPQPHVGFGDGVGGRQDNRLLVGQPQQHQLRGQAAYNILNNPANANLNDLHQPLEASQGNGVHEIVPQNLPQQPVGDDNNNINVAQEDVNAPDVPEDDMDRQAAANQVAEDMDDGHLQSQLRDLSRNDGNAPVVGDFDGKDNGIPLNNRFDDQDVDHKDEDEEMDDYDRHNDDGADNLEALSRADNQFRRSEGMEQLMDLRADEAVIQMALEQNRAPRIGDEMNAQTTLSAATSLPSDEQVVHAGAAQRVATGQVYSTHEELVTPVNGVDGGGVSTTQELQVEVGGTRNWVKW